MHRDLRKKGFVEEQGGPEKKTTRGEKKWATRKKVKYIVGTDSSSLDLLKKGQQGELLKGLKGKHFTGKGGEGKKLVNYGRRERKKVLQWGRKLFECTCRSQKGGAI